MAIGDGGKYDDLATLVRTAANAEAVIVIVCGGDRGSGFAVQANHSWGEPIAALPGLVNAVAATHAVLITDLITLRAARKASAE